MNRPDRQIILSTVILVMMNQMIYGTVAIGSSQIVHGMLYTVKMECHTVSGQNMTVQADLHSVLNMMVQLGCIRR